MLVEPIPARIPNASRLSRWWIFECKRSRRWVRREWPKGTNTKWYDEQMADASLFAGTFVSVSDSWRLAGVRRLIPYEFFRAKIVEKFAWTLRSRMMSCKKNWPSRFLATSISPSAMAIEFLGCSASQAVEHMEPLMVDGMSWSNWGRWHIDHIYPLAAVDFGDIEQVSRVCHFTNLRPLWARDNLRKNAKIENATVTG